LTGVTAIQPNVGVITRSKPPGVLCARLAVAGILVFGHTVLGVTPALAQRPPELRDLYANSHCRFPLRLLVHHKDSDYPYHSHGWYQFKPYDEDRLLASGVILRQIVGLDVYIFAETTDGSRRVWGGNDATTTFNGVTYRLRRVPLTVNDKGYLEFRLTCD
jgi:hypothetical protein